MSPDEWRQAGHMTEILGHQIFYRDSGGADPCLLLLHGYPTSSWDWNPVWRELEARFRVIAFDFLGFGFSARPQRHRYTIAEQAEIAERLLQQRNVSETFLLAHDYGDTVAQELLARQRDPGSSPTELHASCFLNGGLFPESHRPRLIQNLLRSPIGPLLVRIYDQKRFGRSFSAVFGANTQPTEEERADFWTIIADRGGQRILHKLLHYIPERAANRTRWVNALDQLQRPICFICGMDDPVSGAHMAARFREVIRDADVVELPGIGHYPQVEAPQAVLTAFFDFHDALTAQ